MAQRSGATTERPPKHPGPNGLTISKNTGGSYVQRFKIQQERIKALHEKGGENTEKKTTNTDNKSLPKLPAYGVRRENTGHKKFTRGNTIESFKLPGVGAGSVYAQIAKRKQPVPVKTFHLKLNPEHTSLMSKSMPSLPSIPGSPSQDKGNQSPASDYKGSAFPQSHHGMHRYQKFAFQKTIHLDKDASSSPTSAKDAPTTGGKKGSNKDVESVYNNVLPHSHRLIKHRLSVSEPDKDRYDDSSSLKSYTRSRRSRRLSKDAISDTRSEGGYVLNKKWKDDCGCLRCQMLRRQYKEGDDTYNLWGQYPCHRVDFTIGIDDD